MASRPRPLTAIVPPGRRGFVSLYQLQGPPVKGKISQFLPITIFCSPHEKKQLGGIRGLILKRPSRYPLQKNFASYTSRASYSNRLVFERTVFVKQLHRPPTQLGYLVPALFFATTRRRESSPIVASSMSAIDAPAAARALPRRSLARC